MNEIKFRARNANAPRCWIYGYYVEERGHCFIINDDGKFKVRAGTEGQYTGFKDKNDTEVYEDDIVRYNWNEEAELIEKVKYELGCFQLGDVGTLQEWIENDLEVIDNIHVRK